LTRSPCKDCVTSVLGASVSTSALPFSPAVSESPSTSQRQKDFDP
jgi:hypothetical protein